MGSKRVLAFIAVAVFGAAVSVGCTDQGLNSATPTPTAIDSTPSPGAAAVGEWASPDDPDVTLTLNEDGSFVGFDGCNGHSGDWSGPNGGVIHLEFTMHTDAGCPDGVVPWLALSDGAMLRGDALELFGPTDGTTGELARSED
ncbi:MULTISPECIES: META domain-containing protein [Microbacterium]|uniref:META domain-containing protein n=1 Tax=Microbacterium TaxID=33882 RepID=UPI0016504B3C|nr:hypothetical protein [Microbacterium sp. 4-7]MBC6493639.1 hypothetical protein [Microbacterium sp. 4-7]